MLELYSSLSCSKLLEGATVWCEHIYCILTHMQSAIADLISREKTPAGSAIIDPPCGVFSIGLQIQCIREIALSVQQKAYSN